MDFPKLSLKQKCPQYEKSPLWNTNARLVTEFPGQALDGVDLL